jgi:dihydrolipoamide dehydrogenase
MASVARRRAADAGRAAAWVRAYAASGEEGDVVVLGGGPGGYVAVTSQPPRAWRSLLLIAT